MVPGLRLLGRGHGSREGGEVGSRKGTAQGRGSRDRPRASLSHRRYCGEGTSLHRHPLPAVVQLRAGEEDVRTAGLDAGKSG